MLFFVPFFFSSFELVEVKRVLDAAPDVFATLGLSPEDPGWLVGWYCGAVGWGSRDWWLWNRYALGTHTKVTCLDK